MPETEAAVTTAPRFRSPSDLNPQTSRSLLRFCLALADTKYILGYRLSQWTTGAPALEASVACAAITQEEFGHARALFSMLRDVPEAPPELNSATDLKRDRFFYPRALSHPCRSWHQVMALFAVLDPALRQVLQSAGESEYAPLRNRIAKILQEERYHQIFSDGWLERLSSGSEESKNALQQEIDRAAQQALIWLGPPRESTIQRLADEGILGSTGVEIRQAWVESLAAVVHRFGLKLEVSEPDWNRWNSERRDLEGD